MSIVAAAAVPAATPVPPAAVVRAAGGSRLSAVARTALESTRHTQTRVLLATGTAGVVHDRALVETPGDTAPEGARDGVVELPVDTELLAAVAARGGFPRGRTDVLGGELAELILRCAEAVPGGPVLPVELPGDASAGTLEAIAAGLRGAVEATGRRVAVVAAGELATGPVADGADTPDVPADVDDRTAWNERALDALASRDRAALAALGPEEARRVVARGWAPLTVLLTLMEMVGLSGGELHHAVEDGAGRVVLVP